jgi:prepilin-type N-terminal cleavage/methylation domain-containing protein
MGAHTRRARGFSLIELVMVMVVFGIVAAVAAPVVSSGFQAYFTGRDIAEVDWQARVALERMTRELRAMRAPSDLVITAADDIAFVDLDGNTIRYCMGAVGGCAGTAGDLMRNGQPLAIGISNLDFSFLTRAAVATATPAQVYYVTVAFSATRNATSKAHRTTVSPRNFP